MPRPSLREKLAELDRSGLRRRRRTMQRHAPAGDTARLRIDGRTLVDCCSNDYLGLAQHPEVLDALVTSARAIGVGSRASHLVSGHGPEHEALEEEVAAFVGRERALVFSTGYMANLAAIGVLAGRGDRVLLDRLSHASLIDAALLSGARVQRHAHGDAAAAERMLTVRPGSQHAATVLGTDGVFSMDGDLAPLRELAAVAARHDAWLVVDDAHGLGVVGATGRGTLEECALDAVDVPVLVGTFGKAFGTFGAFVAGDADLIEFLIQKSRTYIYTTALPPALAAATRAALEVSQRESWRREKVLAMAQKMRRELPRFFPETREPTHGTAIGTTILPVVIGESQRALAASKALENKGFLVTAIRPPTVPAGTARLRITLSASHEDSQVDGLIAALGEIA
jgi:8-amino-7-oxononanoate synthase